MIPGNNGSIFFNGNCVSILYLCICALDHSIKFISYWRLQSKPFGSHCPRMNVKTRAIASGLMGSAVLEKVRSHDHAIKNCLLLSKRRHKGPQGSSPTNLPHQHLHLPNRIPTIWRMVHSHHSLSAKYTYYSFPDKLHWSKSPSFAHAIPLFGFLFPAWLNSFLWIILNSAQILALCWAIKTENIISCTYQRIEVADPDYARD